MTLMSEGPRFSIRDIWPRVYRNRIKHGAGKNVGPGNFLGLNGKTRIHAKVQT